MALINVAAELTRRNKKVLVVDFDLEAPGLETYNPFSNYSGRKGLVDYILDYLKDRQAPDVNEFLVERRLNGKQIWLMPAGLADKHYGSKLATIDWNQLYTEFDGYLMFEDMKNQWAGMGFDYVLIDSRTGYTDVGGICTRQLPNAVVILFFPNDQNTNGLLQVISDIRSEREEPRNKQIHIHFCPSNVPDLDDEELILQRHLEKAMKRLGYTEPASVIHHYNSLTLLDQQIFVEDRPKSKLAHEYRLLVDAIVAENLEDRAGALSKLNKLKSSIRSRNLISGDYEDVLAEIYKLHLKDGEIGLLVRRTVSSYRRL